VKRELTKVTTTRVEYDLPGVCPNCQVDFTEMGNLQEDRWTATAERAVIVVDMETGEDRYLDYGDSDNIGESMVVGYQCARCDHVLATTEGK
jgi:hypothetical protein